MDNVGQALVPGDIAPHPDELRPRKNWQRDRTIEGNRRIEPSVGRIVIKNERQYRITKAHAEKFRATLNELTAMPRGRSTSIRSCGRHRNAGSKSQLQTGDYQTASFARFARFARLLGLRIRESVELVQK
jgi:hypothetical protein